MNEHNPVTLSRGWINFVFVWWLTPSIMAAIDREAICIDIQTFVRCELLVAMTTTLGQLTNYQNIHTLHSNTCKEL